MKKAPLIFMLLYTLVLPAQDKNDTVKLREVGIKAKTLPVGKTSISATITQHGLEASKGVPLAEALRGIAGVNVLKSGNSIAKPVIHGLHSNRILILNNGTRLEGQAWGAEHAPEIDPMIAGQLTVIKGAESVKYGAEAIAGVVLVAPPDIFSITPADPPVAGAIHTIAVSNGSALSTSAMLKGRLKWPGWGWRLQGTYKKAGNMETPDYVLGNTGLHELNHSAAIGYQTKKASYEAYYSRFSTILGILYSAHAGTIEDITARIAAGRPMEDYRFTYRITAPRQRIIHHLAKAKAHYHLGKQHTLNLGYAYQQNQRREFDSRRGDREALPITDLVLNTHTLDVELGQQKTGGLRRSAGINAMAQTNNNIPGTLANTFIPNYDSFTGGFFFVQKLVRKSYELEAGLRYDFKLFDAAGFRYIAVENESPGGQYYGGKRRFHNVTGSLGALYKISGHWHVASNAGLAWRAPTANELFSNGLHHGAGLYEMGDAGLKSEQGYKWISSLRYLSALLTAEIDVYAQYLRNYIYSQPDLTYKQTLSGTYPVFRYGQTNAAFLGADLSINYQFFPSVSYQLSAAVVRASDLEARSYLPYIPSDRFDHSLRASFRCPRFEEMYLQLGHSFVARQTRYRPGTDYAAPPAAYQLFSLRAAATYPLGTQQLIAHLGVDNLFNTSYKDYMNRYRYYVHETGRSFSIRLAYKF